ncbi:TPA: hypothetical protein TXT41_000962 [Streptococcus suis]|nr:hypothetical protein [Streptococcus suis]HEL2095969.1 hypothetical protein [Streptococcus suis]
MKTLALNNNLEVVGLSSAELQTCKQLSHREGLTTVHFQSFVDTEEKFVAVSCDDSTSNGELKNMIIKKYGEKLNNEIKEEY